MCPPRPLKIPPPPPRPCKGKGDDWCDDENNDLECEWDGGDCCGDNVNFQYCSDCLCLDPTENGNSCQLFKEYYKWYEKS